MYGLKRERKRAGLTAAELAKKLGCTFRAVYDWEAGYYWPRAELLPQIAAALGCTIDDLFREEVAHGTH